MRIKDRLSVLFYNINMKYILNVLLVSNILSPFNTPVRQLNGGSQNEFSYNYVYFVDYYEQEQTASAGVYEYTSLYPKYYGIKVNIVFKQPIKSAKLRMEITAPESGEIAYWDFIGENCYITRNSSTIWYIDCYNCSNATFIMMESYEDLHSNYGYNRTTWNSILESNNTWIDYGHNYCNIRGLQVQSNYVVDNEPDYTSQLNTLLSQTDGIENYLVQIWNQSIGNGQTLTAINTSLSSIKNYLQSINNKLDTLDNIQWLNMPSPTGVYRGYTTDFETYDTTESRKAPGYYVWESFRANNENNYGIYKIKIPIGNADIKYNNLKFYQIYNGELIEFQFDFYLYQQNRNDITIYFVVNNSYHGWPNGNNPLVIYVNIYCYKYSNTLSEFKYILPDNIDYWTIYNTINQFKQLKEINTSLSQIIELLGSNEMNTTDTTNKQTIDNYYEQLIQNMTLPEVPQMPEKVHFVRNLLDIWNGIINNPSLDIFKWFMGMYALGILLKVILK